jgi:hypothetical protein
MDAEDRAGRLHALEAAIGETAWLLQDHVLLTCQDCGAPDWMSPNARYCPECGQRRRAESNRAAQRARRRRETKQRQLAAGMLKSAGVFLIPAPLTCKQCGQPFHPQRTTAQFCSVKCRAAHHRQGG